MKKNQQNRLSESIYTLIKTNGLMLTENGKLRRQTFKEYQIFIERSNNVSREQLITESLKYEYASYYKLTERYEGRVLNSRLLEDINRTFSADKLITEANRLMESEGTVKNPETGRDIKISTALTYDPSHPAHKAAKKATSKKGGDDSHGDDHHDDHHHGPKNLGKKGRLAAAALDIALKKTPGISALAGQSEKILDNMAEVAKSAKEVDGAINKAKAIGSSAKSMISKWGGEQKKKFANSLNDANTGERKKLGSVIKNKAKGFAKGVVSGLKNEAEHIKHQLGDGVDAAKMVGKGLKDGNLKEVLKSDDFKEKATSAVQGLATTAVVGLAVASGPAGMAIKAAALSLNPGDALAQVITADVYFDLQRQGKLNVIRESNKSKAIKLLDESITDKIDKIDESFIVELGMSEGGKELENVEKPMEDYTEQEMDSVVNYTELADNISSGKKQQNESKYPSNYKDFFS